jgi:hypothetical protein
LRRGAKYPAWHAVVIRITPGGSPQIKSAEPLSHIARRLACGLLFIAGKSIL